MQAWTRFQNALQITMKTEIATELSTCIERVLFFFDYQGGVMNGGVESTRGGVANGGVLATERECRRSWRWRGEP